MTPELKNEWNRAYVELLKELGDKVKPLTLDEAKKIQAMYVTKDDITIEPDERAFLARMCMGNPSPTNAHFAFIELRDLLISKGKL